MSKKSLEHNFTKKELAFLTLLFGEVGYLPFINALKVLESSPEVEKALVEQAANDIAYQIYKKSLHQVGMEIHDDDELIYMLQKE